MGKSSTLNVGAGAFVLLGFAALAFLTTQTTNHGIHFGRAGQLLLRHRQVRQHRRPEGGRAGVHGGRGRRARDAHRSRHQAIQGGGLDAAQLEIQPDPERQRREHLHPRVARRKIRRSHRRRRGYVSQEQRSDRLSPNPRIVLENLIGQLVANFSSKGSDSSGSSGSSTSAGDAAPSSKPEKTK